MCYIMVVFRFTGSGRLLDLNNQKCVCEYANSEIVFVL